MDHKQIVAVRLAALDLLLTDDEINQLAAAYASLLKWKISPKLRLMDENFSIYTPLFNLTGFPALALPCGFSASGLPLGFQLAGKPFDEATVFQVGQAYEQSTPWHHRYPAV